MIPLKLQYVREAQLAALITGLHWASLKQLPVTLVAAGLPQLLGQTGKAKSYAERLFAFVSIGRLDKDAATKAPCVPAEKAGSTFNPDALAEILRQTDRYPYFPQESGSEMLRTQENGDDGTGGCARESHSQSAGELRCDAPRRREAERYQGGVLAPPLV